MIIIYKNFASSNSEYPYLEGRTYGDSLYPNFTEKNKNINKQSQVSLSQTFSYDSPIVFLLEGQIARGPLQYPPLFSYGICIAAARRISAAGARELHTKTSVS